MKKRNKKIIKKLKAAHEAESSSAVSRSSCQHSWVAAEEVLTLATKKKRRRTSSHQNICQRVILDEWLVITQWCFCQGAASNHPVLDTKQDRSRRHVTLRQVSADEPCQNLALNKYVSISKSKTLLLKGFWQESFRI